MSYLISLPCLSWPMLPRSVKSGLASTEPRKIKKITVMQYSDLFWVRPGGFAEPRLKNSPQDCFCPPGRKRRAQAVRIRPLQHRAQFHTK